MTDDARLDAEFVFWERFTLRLRRGATAPAVAAVLAHEDLAAPARAGRVARASLRRRDVLGRFARTAA